MVRICSRPTVVLAIASCLAWSTAFAGRAACQAPPAPTPAAYMAEGIPIVVTTTTTTSSTTTTTAPINPCIAVPTAPATGQLFFMFGDGKGGFANLTGGWAHTCSNGQITSLHASFSGSGSAGNLAHPFYRLSAALSYPPPSLSLSLSPAPPGGVTTIAVRNLSMSQNVTPLPIPGLYHVVLSGSFTSCHPNHGCGGGNFAVQGDISCC